MEEDETDAMHLDARIHAELLAGTLGRDAARALARHLEAGCEDCEAFLASRERTDGLDGRVERALLALAPAPAARTSAMDDGAFARVERQLAAAGVSPSQPAQAQAQAQPGARATRKMGWVPLAAAASVLAAGLAGVALHGEGPAPPAWDGTKGAGAESALAAPVRLRFLVVEGEGEGAAMRLRRGASGQAVPASAGLQFEVEVERATHVTLVRVGADGAPEPVWEGALAPGASLVEVGGRAAVYRLEGLRGSQRFVALTSGAPLAPGDLPRALAGRPAAGPVGDAEVEVRIE